MEFVLVGFEVAQLGELFAAVFQSTDEWLCSLVDDSVGTDVASLGKSFTALFADEGLLAGVSPLVGLQVAHLREFLTTAWLGASLEVIGSAYGFSGRA